MPENKFRTQFDLGNEAFDTPEKRRREIARILRHVASRIEEGENCNVFVFDINGNVIGNWGFAEVGDEEEPDEPEEPDPDFLRDRQQADEIDRSREPPPFGPGRYA